MAGNDVPVIPAPNCLSFSYFDEDKTIFIIFKTERNSLFTWKFDFAIIISFEKFYQGDRNASMTYIKILKKSLKSYRPWYGLLTFCGEFKILLIDNNIAYCIPTDHMISFKFVWIIKYTRLAQIQCVRQQHPQRTTYFTVSDDCLTIIIKSFLCFHLLLESVFMRSWTWREKRFWFSHKEWVKKKIILLKLCFF